MNNIDLEKNYGVTKKQICEKIAEYVEWAKDYYPNKLNKAIKQDMADRLSSVSESELLFAEYMGSHSEIDYVYSGVVYYMKQGASRAYKTYEDFFYTSKVDRVTSITYEDCEGIAKTIGASTYRTYYNTIDSPELNKHNADVTYNVISTYMNHVKKAELMRKGCSYSSFELKRMTSIPSEDVFIRCCSVSFMLKGENGEYKKVECAHIVPSANGEGYELAASHMGNLLEAPRIYESPLKKLFKKLFKKK